MHRTHAPVPVIDRVALTAMGIAILVAAAVGAGLGREFLLAIIVFVGWMLAIPLMNRIGDSDSKREPALKPGELSWPGFVWAWLAIAFCFCWALCLGWKEVVRDELKATMWQRRPMSWLDKAFLGCLLLVAGAVLVMLGFAGLPWKLGVAGAVALLVGWRLNRELKEGE